MTKPRRTTRQRSTSDAAEIIRRLFVGRDPERRRQVAQALDDAVIGKMIYDARVKARLTQKQLAAMIDSDQSVISRLEDADYEGHSLSMLRRIAEALGKRLDIRFVDAA